jgi:hypothetical protein
MNQSTNHPLPQLVDRFFQYVVTGDTHAIL